MKYSSKFPIGEKATPRGTTERIEEPKFKNKETLR